MAGIPVQGGDLIVTPQGQTLRMPRMGQQVLVGFPSKGWVCPGWVVKPHNIKDKDATVGVVMLNINVMLIVQKHMNLKHRSFAVNDEPFWFYPD